jgi:hypothetical protein
LCADTSQLWLLLLLLLPLLLLLSYSSTACKGSSCTALPIRVVETPSEGCKQAGEMPPFCLLLLLLPVDAAAAAAMLYKARQQPQQHLCMFMFTLRLLIVCNSCVFCSHSISYLCS